MKLSELLDPDRILLPLRADDKWQAIGIMAQKLAELGGFKADRANAANEALMIRERSMTTGMEHGIAIPHAVLDDLTELHGVLALAPEPIPFETIDGSPARILVCLLIPRSEKLLHIRTLAEIAKLLSKAEVREQLLAAESAPKVLDAIRAAE